MGSISFQKQRKTKKKISIKPIHGHLRHQIRFYNKEMVVGLPCVNFKNRSTSQEEKTEANQVLGLALTVSTRKVDLITSKAMVSEKVLVLAKSRSEKGAKNLVSNSLEHFYERRKQMAFLG